MIVGRSAEQCVGFAMHGLLSKLHILNRVYEYECIDYEAIGGLITYGVTVCKEGCVWCVYKASIEQTDLIVHFKFLQFRCFLD